MLYLLIQLFLKVVDYQQVVQHDPEVFKIAVNQSPFNLLDFFLFFIDDDQVAFV